VTILPDLRAPDADRRRGPFALPSLLRRAPAEEVAARRAELDVAADEAPLEDAALEAGFSGPTLVALALFRP